MGRDRFGCRPRAVSSRRDLDPVADEEHGETRIAPQPELAVAGERGGAAVGNPDRDQRVRPRSARCTLEEIQVRRHEDVHGPRRVDLKVPDEFAGW